MVKGHTYDDLYARLETKEGEKELYRLARQRDRAGKDVQHERVIKDENGNVMVNSEAVLKRWKYFEKLMNEEINREPRTEEAEVVNKEVNYNYVSREEIKNALRRMKKGKAVGPDELPVEVWKCMGKMGIKFLTRLFNRLLMGERMPEEWRRSVLILIYKRAAWVKLNCLRTGVGRFHSSMHKWGRAPSPNCECGTSEQTADHVLTACPIHWAPHGARGLTVLDNKTRCWLNDITASI